MVSFVDLCRSQKVMARLKTGDKKQRRGLGV